MRKTDKKHDNQIRMVLSQLCEDDLKSLDGFMWLTHNVDFNRFPDSLSVVCVFDTTIKLDAFLKSGQKDKIVALITAKLASKSITLSKPQKQIQFDCEEAWDLQHGGNWAKRLRR